MFQTKEQDNFPETDGHEMAISNLPGKEFKIIKILTNIRPMHEQNENFNKKRENI